MKIYITNTNDKFDLWDYLHLQSEVLDINFEDINIGEDKVEQTISVELKEIKGNTEWEYFRTYGKLFQILKLYVKKYDSQTVGEEK